MKKWFKGEYYGVWHWFLHIGPWAAFVIINFIAATLLAVVMAALIWWHNR